MSFFLFIGGSPLQSQNTSENALQKLSFLFDQIYNGPPQARWANSDSFSIVLRQLMDDFAGKELAFEQIPHLRYFTGENLRFRLVNWSVPESDGNSSYRGVLQVWNENKQNYICYTLNDISAYQPYPENVLYTPDNWWGALYYDCIEHKIGDRIYYTLLGLNTSVATYQQKVIDVFQIKKNGEVEFGASIFSSAPKYSDSKSSSNLKRIIFRFSRKTDMILRYDYQTYITQKGKKKIEVKDQMIVFDYLIPPAIHLLEECTYYVPSGGLYNAYVFMDDHWELQTEIIARNPNPKIPQKKKSTKPILYKPL